MSYEQFEKSVCDVKQELDRKNSLMNPFIFRNHVDCNSVQDVLREDTLKRTPYVVHGSCYVSKDSYPPADLCTGYDCMTYGSFYHHPDRKNTYHNYLVLQDKLYNNVPVSCTNNHQIFNNWTRRKIPQKVEESTKNNKDLFEDIEPIQIPKMKQCNIPKTPYQC